MAVTRTHRFPFPDEDRFISSLKRTLPVRGPIRISIGDDASVLTDGTVITTDGYIEGIHFSRRYLTHREIGMRSACAALSDIIAMGARPTGLYITLGLPSGISRSDIRALYRGLDIACSQLGCGIAGGDTIAADRLLLALTGTGNTRHPLLRSSARPSEYLYITGCPGAAETGRLLLTDNPGASRRNPAVARHTGPIPRLPAMLALRRSISALIDSSDGIATDARRIANASGVRITIEPERLPALTATMNHCRKNDLDLIEFMLTAGDDYELLFTAGRLTRTTVAGIPVTRIGRVEAGRGLWLSKRKGLQRIKLHGYDHFA